MELVGTYHHFNMTPAPLSDVLGTTSDNSQSANGNNAEYVYANDVHITEYQPLISPALLIHETPVNKEAKATIAKARAEASGVISGKDDRLLVVVGPCSIHNVDAALEYGSRLKELIPQLPGLVVIMRAYFESES